MYTFFDIYRLLTSVYTGDKEVSGCLTISRNILIRYILHELQTFINELVGKSLLHVKMTFPLHLQLLKTRDLNYTCVVQINSLVQNHF